MRRIFWGISAVVLALLLVLTQQWISFLKKPLNSSATPIYFKVLPHTSVEKVIQQLQQLGLLKHPWFFETLIYLKAKNRAIHAGEYYIQPHTLPGEFVEQLLAGKVLMRKIMFIPGWNFKQIFAAVQKNPYLKHSLENKTPETIMEILGAEAVSSEGQFYPDTYFFSSGTSDIVILRKAQQKMQRVLNAAWENKATDLPYKTPYEVLIVASLIEKEAKAKTDREKISGVILRRLKINMPLQIDPTVIFALGDNFKGKLTHADMQLDSPYNTYRHKGLPPTPIGSPTAAAILAAVHPQKASSLYYVAKRDGSGTHHFSDTYREHKLAIQKFLRAPKLVKNFVPSSTQASIISFPFLNYCPLPSRKINYQ